MGNLSRLVFTFIWLTSAFFSYAQHSIARIWCEELLESIREDFARPTVNARNLHHISAAMYDAWALGDRAAETYLIGKELHGYTSPFDGFTYLNAQQVETAISYAAFRLIQHRFQYSPGATATMSRIRQRMVDLGLDPNFRSLDYKQGNPAALGNFIADQYIKYGLQDGSNEINGYSNLYYEPVNPPLVPTNEGNPELVDPNYWQPLSLERFIDQSGNEIPGSSPPFLSAEWGQVAPFALKSSDLTVHRRDNFDWWVYHDPGPPPFINPNGPGPDNEFYKWNFALVSAWSGHLDPTDGVLWDISPASLGNSTTYPKTEAEYRAFYDLTNGGTSDQGYSINPYTGLPYQPQIVPRGDYARILAEFWADGPESETPPGHWFSIFNYVADHPLLQRKYRGQGPVLSKLEWDIKGYFMLGGAVHDAAVTAWGIKGRYDYVRPISAIRWMAQNGQSSNPDLPGYHPNGLPLVPDFIEVIQAGDPLAGENNERVGMVKVKAWKGHAYIPNPETDNAGVDWILGVNWWPYQRQSFVTPPFAGYISGHSTFSRSAAEMMAFFTGDAYFPGGLGEFPAPKNNFLVFENGPSVEVVLQWATYRDASDQCSLSRIWGSIHPPVDDIPGRLLGIKIAADAASLADRYFNGRITAIDQLPEPVIVLYPNSISVGEKFYIEMKSGNVHEIMMMDTQGKPLRVDIHELRNGLWEISSSASSSGMYFVVVNSKLGNQVVHRVIVR